VKTRYQVEFAIADYQSGVYYLSIERENIQEVKKIIV
jgi:hypothetical protein